MYKAGKRPIDIANAIGIPASTVRRWKSTQKWDTISPERSGKKKANARERHKLAQEIEKASTLTDQQKDFCLYYVHSYNATSSYYKVFGCSYESARRSGPRLLQREDIRREIERLKEIKRQSILADIDDLVDINMRIAFADLSDYVEWGRSYVPVMGPFGPIQVDDGSGEKVTLQKEVNDVKFKESYEVDGTLIAEVKVGRDGASIKLADRQKALQWLSDYFLANPLDRHKVEYDKKKLELEERKLQQEESDQKDLEDVSGIRSEVFDE